jgi:hypothetical protein
MANHFNIVVRPCIIANPSTRNCAIPGSGTVYDNQNENIYFLMRELSPSLVYRFKLLVNVVLHVTAINVSFFGVSSPSQYMFPASRYTCDLESFPSPMIFLKKCFLFSIPPPTSPMSSAYLRSLHNSQFSADARGPCKNPNDGMIPIGCVLKFPYFRS